MLMRQFLPTKFICRALESPQHIYHLYSSLKMVSSRTSSFLISIPHRSVRPRLSICPHQNRHASTYTGTTELSEDIEPSSSLQAPGPSEDHLKTFNPIARARRRKTQLPPSRCVNFLLSPHQETTPLKKQPLRYPPS